MSAPVSQHISKTINALKKLLSTDTTPHGCLFVSGNSTRYHLFTDIDLPFQQYKHFLYLTGCNEPNICSIIDLESKDITTFRTAPSVDDAVWHGHVESQDEFCSRFSFKKVLPLKSLSSFVKDNYSNASVTVFTTSKDAVSSHFRTLKSSNSFENAKIDVLKLEEALKDARRIKTSWEIEKMSEINKISSDCHKKLWQTVKVGMSELEMESIFRQQCMVGSGSRYQSYGPIFAIGSNAAILHYSGSAEKKSVDGDLVLVDAGAQATSGYTSDITRCFPVNGKFSEKQAKIYNAVLKAQDLCISGCKPGIHWKEIQMTAVRSIGESLIELGLCKGSLEDVVKSGTVSLFYPHGVGHLIGLDTHDINSRQGLKLNDPEYIYHRFLRFRRPLEPGYVMTVEPGLYFIPALLTPAFSNSKFAKYLDKSVIETYMSVGGVRIEDNIVITSDGVVNLTTAPKSIPEIESIMAGPSTTATTATTC